MVQLLFEYGSDGSVVVRICCDGSVVEYGSDGSAVVLVWQ
jgi:hypothetical protein